MFNKSAPKPYQYNIFVTAIQQEYMVDNVLNYLDKIYYDNDSKRMVLDAFTGSGKTTVTLKVLIPEFFKKYHKDGKRYILFMSPIEEVVEQTYHTAMDSIHNTTVDGLVMKCYNSSDINHLKNKVKIYGDKTNYLDGDLNVLFLTAQYFVRDANYKFLWHKNSIVTFLDYQSFWESINCKCIRIFADRF
jgi:superfamily II DNA or RNA helicase